MTRDAIVIGGGVNGLVTAALLGRRGRRVLLLERRDSLGGVCATEEFHPGFRANSCVDDTGWVPSAVEQELDLARHGFAPAFAPVGLVAPRPEGPPLILTADVQATAAALRPYAARDADRWEDFTALIARLSGFLEHLYGSRAPRIQGNAPSDLLALLSMGRRLRGLGRRGMVDLLRTVPMPIADLLDEWFEDGTLQAALATEGVRDVQHGPLSGGTSLVFLHRHVGMRRGLVGGRRLARGGVGGLVDALAAAARAAGVEIRYGAAVAGVLVRDDRARGVVLEGGEELEAPVVVSSADPRRTLLTMVDAGHFDPEFLSAVAHVRMRGPAARVHLALSRLPSFVTGKSRWPDEALRGAITIAPSVLDIERAYDAAKHGGVSPHPVLSATIPTLADPSLAPAGQHVLSIHVQYAAWANRSGREAGAREALGDAAVRSLAVHAPDLPGAILHREVLTPVDLEARYGVTEGSLLHGELALDQFLFMRPVPDCARHATPLAGLWLCGSGTHPGAGTAGASGLLAAREILAAESTR
jgi:phytoene dehydrogenase-like protein